MKARSTPETMGGAIILYSPTSIWTPVVNNFLNMQWLVPDSTYSPASHSQQMPRIPGKLMRELGAHLSLPSPSIRAIVPERMSED